MTEQGLDLSTLLGQGDPEAVAAAIGAGQDIRYKREHGYDALLDAVHSRDISRDTRLLDLLRLLIAHRVDLNTISSYNESGLRVLSNDGRFDAVEVLLAAGADESQLSWTPLIRAVALGSLDDVDSLLHAGAELEASDYWQRTAWLVALAKGDLAKAQRLQEAGANTNARGRCGKRPLFYAIEGHHPHVVSWLLEAGQQVDQEDDFGGTPLLCAIESRDLKCARLLLAAGANVNHDHYGTPINHADSRETVQLLLDAGADAQQISQEGHRALCGLGPVIEVLSDVSNDDFTRARSRRFGAANPERFREPFWEAMVRTGLSGSAAAHFFGSAPRDSDSPVWSAQRFGQSTTLLPDGRVIQIGGEHEDYYDSDFCIYNDVFVHGPEGSIEILGYPRDVFPPTDFHTATLEDRVIYVIGSLGYMGAREYERTPLFRLNLDTFQMQPVVATGDAPGWIHRHRARSGSRAIHVTGGTVVTVSGPTEVHTPNTTTFVLDLDTLVWRREPT